MLQLISRDLRAQGCKLCLSIHFRWMEVTWVAIRNVLPLMQVIANFQALAKWNLLLKLFSFNFPSQAWAYVRQVLWSDQAVPAPAYRVCICSLFLLFREAIARKSGILWFFFFTNGGGGWGVVNRISYLLFRNIYVLGTTVKFLKKRM